MRGSRVLVKYLADRLETQTAFAARTGLLVSMVCHYCNGSRRPGLAAALAIHDATDGAVAVAVWAKRKGKRAAKSAA